MSLNVTDQVFIYFDLALTGGDVFTLDDPVKGKLDDTTYLLSGDVATDVSDYVQQVTVTRGRSRELDEIVPGSLSVELVNYDGRFIPDAFGASNDPAAYGAGAIEVGRRIQMTTEGTVIFDGFVEDWTLDYQAADNTVRTSVTAYDALAQLSFKRFNGWTATASQVAGARIADILDRPEVDWGQARSLKDDTGSYQGVSTLQGDSVTYGSNVLNYCQLVAKSDLGRFFADRVGLLTFIDRHSLVNTTTTLAFDDDPDTTAIPFVRSSLRVGSELLYSDVSVDREGGTAQTANSATSRAAYGIRRLDIDGLLLNSDAQSLDMAQYLVGVYSAPQPRIPSITVRLDRLTAMQRAELAALDLASVVSVTWTPRGAQQLSQTFVVEGVSHTADINVHDVVLQLSPIQQAESLVLDDTVLGELDSALLGF